MYLTLELLELDPLNQYLSTLILSEAWMSHEHATL